MLLDKNHFIANMAWVINYLEDEAQHGELAGNSAIYFA